MPMLKPKHEVLKKFDSGYIHHTLFGSAMALPNQFLSSFIIA
jgi:hypothetical protein